MAELLFTFGPGNSFFFDTPEAWDWRNLPPGLSKCFAKDQGQDRAKTIYWCAIGPNGTYALLYTTHGDTGKMSREGAGPDRVYNWSKNFGASQTKIALGPDGSFFGIAGETSGYLTEGLPSGLEQLAKDDDGRPICEVALGANDHYVALRRDGGFNYSLSKKCELDGILDQAPSGTVAHVSLSPTNDENFFIAFTDGSCKFCVPENWKEDIKSVAAKNGVPFTISTTPAAFMYSGYSGYSTEVNTGYRTQAVVGRNETRSIKKFSDGLSITNSLLSIGFLIGSTVMACNVM